MGFQVRAVGVIHTNHATKEETPIQGPFHPDAMGAVELFPEFVAGLKDIDVLDGAPLIDIKPYVPRFDSFPDATEGWFAGKGVTLIIRFPETPSSSSRCFMKGGVGFIQKVMPWD